MKISTEEKTTPKEGALLSLLGSAEYSGYEVEWVSGDGGTFHYWKKQIKVGKEQSLDDKIVVLAHELGHGRDYEENPPGAQELILMTCFPDAWKVGEQYYKRERKAWDYAALILKDIDVWDLVSFYFGAYKKSALSAYYQRHIRAKEEGKDKPEQLLFDKVYYEIVEGKNEPSTD